MAYKFPYAGSEEKQPLVVRIPKKKPEVRPIISCVPDYIPPLPEKKLDIRPINIPPMADSLKKILLSVAEKRNVHPNDIVGIGQSVAVVEARRDFIWEARTTTKASFPQIGRAIKRDHTTVIYHYSYAEAKLNNEDPRKLQEARRRLYKRVKNQTELNERQTLVRGFVLRGYTTAQIAVELGVSLTTVKMDKQAIRRLQPIPDIVLKESSK